ncbi:hypothetical protein M436DRAFT_39847 [Aureobasidium namibiae CBS 147.97]|uniref:DNA recombination and repair protein Rad51-like C-terminal domain-containing protein n=1 Tax=Aureobasidium namibiae CBS 147.97 TaxID=1043004 RepID=A0A074WS18_9PEZI
MAAKPVLASDLITTDSIGLFEERARKRPRVGTQCCASVDDALSGGLVYGQDGIYNISGATGSRAAETISLQMLITHLLTAYSHTATLIDASGNFDVLSLYRGLLSRLSTTNTNHEDNIKTATSILDRVNIMRVFDFEGVVEGLNELIDSIERKQIPKNTIRDSQEEAEEEEVLILPEEEARQEKEKQQEEKPAAGMVLINNLSQVLGLLLKDNYARGQATMTSLIQRLRNMAQEHNLCVVLLSWSVSYGSDQERVSIFESVKARPGLGKSLGYLVDTQLLIDAIPRKARSKSGDTVNVIEVIHSGGNHQAGKFGVFDVTADAEIKSVSF